VIDRYTYYNLEFLESQVREPTSKLTMGDLFDSYDEEKIHSHPGIRYDLFPGGEAAARSRLVMDFFGNVQNVEVEGGVMGNVTEWQEDLKAIERMVIEARRRHEDEEQAEVKNTPPPQESPAESKVKQARKEGAVKIDSESGWTKQVVGVAALLGCAGIWAAGSFLDGL
jgi:glycosylphosphatidylinositol transamidase (GPIT) subunit GPI8